MSANKLKLLGNNGQKTAAPTPSASNKYPTFNPGGYHQKSTTNYNY